MKTMIFVYVFSFKFLTKQKMLFMSMPEYYLVFHHLEFIYF